ncbi:MAG TPA: peptidoglycan DD-metalloendopeptidase family protein [Saprospiraceae bacterium]|nr:peptidoglycan DD-metalloendopeptidase family protein [Saprospiraceae bacterium]
MFRDPFLSASLRATRKWPFKLTLLCLFLATASQGQQIGQLESKKELLLQEISRTSELLKKTEGEKNSAVSSLITLRSGIKKRQDLLKTIDDELSSYSDTLAAVEGRSRLLESYLQKLEGEYLRMSRQHFIQKKLTPSFSFILAAEDFKKMFERLIYLGQYQNTRKRQLREMIQTIHQLHQSKIHYELALLEKESLLDEQKQQQQNLENELSKKNKLVKKLEGREEEFRVIIDKKKKEVRGLEEEIKRRIEASIAAAAREKESTLNTSSFEELEGKLPLPAGGGTVIEDFGVHGHHSLPGVKIKNNGLDFAFKSNTEIRNVLRGTVKGVMNIPGYHDVILISHGEYFTLYGHLRDIRVKVGEELTERKVIGVTRINSETGHPSLHFELWKGKTPLDPKVWFEQKERI